MRINEESINHNALRLIKGASEDFECAEGEELDGKSTAYMNFTRGVIAMADCMKDVLKIK